MPRSSAKKKKRIQYATKDDFKKLDKDIEKLATATKVSFDRLDTKVDRIEGRIEGRMDGLETRMDSLETAIENTEKRLTTAIKAGITKIMDHIDVAVENRKTDLLGVSQDEIVLIKKKSNDHEERITTLEQRQGLRS